MPRGGKREGSGRKPGKRWDGSEMYEKRKRRLFGLTSENDNFLSEAAQRMKIAKTTIVNEAIDHYRYWLAEKEKKSDYVRQCLICDREYIAGRVIDGHRLCAIHETEELLEHLTKWQGAIKRAEKANLEATLTFKQWLAIYDDFDGLCAYCLDRPGQSIEHFVRIADGGGTTAANCVPSCVSCNMRKDHYRGRTVPDSDMERVKNYLASRAAIDMKKEKDQDGKSSS